jgi:glycosyltransferase involved in cell wall biosynthesis
MSRAMPSRAGAAPGSEPSARGAPRRAVIVTHSHYPDDPRAVKHATALHEAGFEVIVLALRRAGEAKRETLGGVDVRRLPLEHKRGGGARYLFEYFGIFALSFWELTWLSLARRPFAVQVNNPPDFLIFAAVVPKMLGARLILDMHEPMPELYASIRGLDAHAFPVRALRAIEGLATRFADRVVTVSEICRKTFAARGTAAEKITVVKNVCDLELFDPRRHVTAAASGATANGVQRVIYHGTLVGRYGVDLLVRAFARVRDRFPAARLEIFGRGETMEELAALARELGVADRVHFGGQVALSSIPAKIAAADVGVVPNRKDIFMDLVLPTKLFEYIAMEKPVVVARTAAVIDHFGAQDLYLFEPGDVDALARTLEDALSHPGEARERVQRLRERCAGETWAAEKQKLIGVYEGLRGS